MTDTHDRPTETFPPHPCPGALAPALVFTHLDPAWLDAYSDAEIVALAQAFEIWARPEQHIPAHRWRTCGLTGGRGFGKTIAAARYINPRVMAGLETQIALMAPTEDRVDEVQIKALIDYAEPWQRPERYRGGLRWPNGVEALVFSPEGKAARGDNISLSWCTEIVDWKPGTQLDAFQNLLTATRRGEERLLWDSTAKGRNEVRTLLEEWHKSDPREHVIVPGTMFDNHLLSTTYLRGQWRSYTGVRRDEELFGMSFNESAGACWKQHYFDRWRVDEVPAVDWWLVTVDPATSDYATADETGITKGGRGRDGHAYLTRDASGKYRPEDWGDLVVELANPAHPGQGRVGIERKRIGDQAVFVIKSRAENRGLRVQVIGRDEPWPAWDPRRIYVREYNTNDSKGTRAEGPAAECDAGRVHLVGVYPDLEKECTTYVPGQTKRSPNRLDAFAYLVTELRELALDAPPDHARDAAVAADMHRRVDEALRRAVPHAARVVQGLTVSGGRRLGL